MHNYKFAFYQKIPFKSINQVFLVLEREIVRKTGMDIVFLLAASSLQYNVRKLVCFYLKLIGLWREEFEYVRAVTPGHDCIFVTHNHIPIFSPICYSLLHSSCCLRFCSYGIRPLLFFNQIICLLKKNVSSSIYWTYIDSLLCHITFALFTQRSTNFYSSQSSQKP